MLPASQPASPEPDAGGSPGCTSFYTPRDRRNLRRFFRWTIAASLLYVGATAALRWRGAVPAALPWLLVAATLAFAVLAVRGYLAFLREADELLRRIELGGLAFGFGAGAVFSLLYPLLERLGAPALWGEATAVVMMLSWSAGAWLAARRYSARGAA